MHQRVVMFVIWVFISGLSSSLWSQTSDTPGVEDGPLNELRKSMRLLLPIALDQDMRLHLDRKVWKANSLSAEERKEREISKWTKRGMDRARAEEYADRVASNKTGFDDLLDEMVANVGRMTGSSQMAMYGGRSFDLIVKKSNGTSKALEFVETKSPRRKLSVSDDSDGGFQVLLIGSDYLIQIDQKANRPLRIVMIFDDEPFLSRTDSFIEFADNYPDRCDHLLKILDNVGFDAPPMKNSPEVASLAKLQLAALFAEPDELLDKLFAEMESDEFGTRDEAQKTLQKQFQKYESLIRAKMGESSASPQLKSGLKKIIQEASADATNTRAIDFITSQNLLNSPQYLGSLLQDANSEEHALIFRQLDKATGQKFKEDIDALHEYLQKNK